MTHPSSSQLFRKLIVTLHQTGQVDKDRHVPSLQWWTLQRRLPFRPTKIHFPSNLVPVFQNIHLCTSTYKEIIN